jgi:hypothetical protein
VEGLPICTICGRKDPPSDHLAKEHPDRRLSDSCQDKPLRRHGKVFSRWDHLKKRFTKVHPGIPLKDYPKWSKFSIAPSYSPTCDQCLGRQFLDWDDRIAHLACHFEETSNLQNSRADQHLSDASIHNVLYEKCGITSYGKSETIDSLGLVEALQPSALQSSSFGTSTNGEDHSNHQESCIASKYAAENLVELSEETDESSIGLLELASCKTTNSATHESPCETCQDDIFDLGMRCFTRWVVEPISKAISNISKAFNSNQQDEKVSLRLPYCRTVSGQGLFFVKIPVPKKRVRVFPYRFLVVLP